MRDSATGEALTFGQRRAQAGSQSSISDLTTAAGWEILDCDGSTADQDIRLVCSDDSKGCDHPDMSGVHDIIAFVCLTCLSIYSAC